MSKITWKPNGKFQLLGKDGRKSKPFAAMIIGVTSIYTRKSTALRQPVYFVGLNGFGYPLTWEVPGSDCLNGMSIENAIKFAIMVNQRLTNYSGSWEAPALQQYLTPVKDVFIRYLQDNQNEQD